ncbi:MAG: peptidase M3 [Pseudonocardiales bacterium]|nr:MAG: peptidase M3 [Pseudonocardiales bacterium]
MSEPAGLAPLSLPADDEWSPFLGQRTDRDLAQAGELLESLKDGTTRTSEQTLELWNDADIALRNAGALAGLLAQVHPDEHVRTLAEDREQQVARFSTDRDLDRGLYDALVDVDATDLDGQAARMLDLVLRDFRRGGVDRAERARERLRELSEQLTLTGQQFSRNIRDDIRTIRIAPNQLAGLPPDFVDSHPVEDDGLISITTDYPDVIPFRTFARDPRARLELTTAFLNRAWPQNDALLRELLHLRAEQASLLGYESWPAFDAEVKMIGTSAALAQFIERITTLAEPAARRDFDVLLQRRQLDEPSAAGLDASNSSYYSELVRREQFDVDAHDVRRYFDFARVRGGLLEVTGRLFDIEYEPVADAPVWHPDVAVYDVRVGTERRGRIYLDLHPRPGKFKHAAQFELVPGVAGRQLPEGVLVCNLPRGLMEHSDVVTLFHEFGHLLHHVLGGAQRWVRFSGVATEWDFVEAPSQMLEEWAWDVQILRSFARDGDGDPIPEELVERMRAAKEFGKAHLARTQMFYAALSYRLHIDLPEDVTAAARELQARYDLFDYIDGTHFHASFGHLEGYTSAYYTYMWSLVIAKDLFSAFDLKDMFDSTVAGRYRDEILARGGNADAADLVTNFLGRPYSFEAFGHWLAEAPARVS